jgi:outer membrane immunogenic protein
MIKKLLLTTALACLSATAFAADLPSRRAPPVYAPPPIPIFSWTGFYMGGQVGYAFGRETSSIFGAGGALIQPTYAANPNPNGIIGGGHVGYNFSTQSLPVFGGALGTGGVIGVEGDVDGSDYRRNPYLVPAPFGGTGSVRNSIQGSIRGRLGFAVDRALFYATGGAAFATFNTSYSFAGGTDSFSHTRVGWTVGGGVEYAITNNWSLRAEYRYSDFGTFVDPLTARTLSAGFVIRHRETEQRAQVGFSYKFDTLVPAPVVARY